MVLKLIDSRHRNSDGRRMLTVGMLVAAPLILFSVFGGGDDTAAASSVGKGIQADSPATAVLAMSELSVYTLSAFSVPGQPVNDTVVGDGLQRLSSALEVVLGRNPDVGEHHAQAPSELRASATQLLALRDEQEKRRVAQAAFISAAEAAAAIQRRNFPDLAKAAAELRSAATDIRVDRAFDAQSLQLETFFERASDILRAMIEMRP